MTKCVRCGNPIEHRRSNAMYCSEQCGIKTRYKRHYENNPTKLKEKRDKVYSNPAKAMHWRVKSRAKKNNIPFDIDVEDIVIPELCPILLIPLKTRQGKGYHPDSPSLDRIVPKLGYVKGNVRVISARANLLKNDASELELTAILDDIRRLQREGFIL